MNRRLVWLVIVVISVIVGVFNVAYGIAFLAAFLVPILDALGAFGKKEEPQQAKRDALDRELTEVYSPIHSMIMEMNRIIPLDGPAYGFVEIRALADFGKVRSIFRDKVHVLGDERLEMWLNFERTFTQVHGHEGFYLDKRWADWFRELEQEYRELTKELKRFAT